MTAPRCPRCGGLNGSHGFVHVRHGNGGGHNEPCPVVDAPDKHIYLNDADPIGGYVCATCEMPTETEPCAEHQPNAYAAMDQP